jgi:hypothetical protein
MPSQAKLSIQKDGILSKSLTPKKGVILSKAKDLRYRNPTTTSRRELTLTALLDH